MTRVLNGTLSTDLADQSLTLCRCWEITKTDGTVNRVTDHDQDLTFLSNTFESDNGFTISAVESGENLAVDNADLKVLLSTGNVTQADIINGVYDGATVKVWLVNFNTPANYTALPGAYLSQMNSADTDSAVFEMISISSKLNQNIGRRLIPMCDADLGDSRCGVNPLLFPPVQANVE